MWILLIFSNLGSLICIVHEDIIAVVIHENEVYETNKSNCRCNSLKLCKFLTFYFDSFVWHYNDIMALLFTRCHSDVYLNIIVPNKYNWRKGSVRIMMSHFSIQGILSWCSFKIFFSGQLKKLHTVLWEDVYSTAMAALSTVLASPILQKKLHSKRGLWRTSKFPRKKWHLYYVCAWNHFDTL